MILSSFLGGITVITFFFSGIFFWKFWRASKDIFFLHFAIACELLAVERGVGMGALVLYGVEAAPDSRFWIYVIRLLAFSFILIAVIERNRGSKFPKSRG